MSGADCLKSPRTVLLDFQLLLDEAPIQNTSTTSNCPLRNLIVISIYLPSQRSPAKSMHFGIDRRPFSSHPSLYLWHAWTVNLIEIPSCYTILSDSLRVASKPIPRIWILKRFLFIEHVASMLRGHFFYIMQLNRQTVINAGLSRHLCLKEIVLSKPRILHTYLVARATLGLWPIAQLRHNMSQYQWLCLVETGS